MAHPSAGAAELADVPGDRAPAEQSWGVFCTAALTAALATSTGFAPGGAAAAVFRASPAIFTKFLAPSNSRSSWLISASRPRALPA